MAVLELTFSVDQGSQGIDNDPTNPLSRALNRLFENGKPFAAMSLCFFGEFPNSTSTLNSTQSSPLRWLGIFVHSAGDRILFFPGLIFSGNGTQLFRKRSRQLHIDPVFNVDHISLEKNFTRYHFTTYKSKAHIAKQKTYPLGNGRFLWFSMSIPSETELRELKAETTVTTNREHSVILTSHR